MFRIKESFNVFFKISKVSAVIFLFSIFTLSVVNAHENGSDNMPDDYTANGKSNDGKGLYVLGQIWYNGAYADPYGFPTGFTVNGLLGLSVSKFFSGRSVIRF